MGVAARMSASVAPAGPRLASRSRPWTDAALLFVLAFALRLWGLGREPYWTDEIFSLYWSQGGQAFLWGEARLRDTNPPLHYAFLNLWIGLVGTSEAWVRLPAAMASALAVPIAYALGRSVLGRRAGLLGAVLLAFSPLALAHGQEARGYAFLMLTNAVALLAVARHWRHGRHAAGARRLLWPMTTVLAVILGVQLHFTAILFAAALFGAVGIVLLATRPLPLREFTLWLVAGAIAGAVSLWQVLDAMALSAAPGTAWIWPLGPWTLGVFVTDFVGGPRLPLQWMGVAAALPVCGVVGLALLRHPPGRRAAWLVLVVAPALFLLLLLGVSLARPLLISRYGLWLVVPLCLLVAHAAVAPRGAMRALAIAAIVFAWGSGFLAQRFASPRDDWPRLAAALRADQGCSGPVVFGPFSSPVGLVHYAPALRQREMRMIAMPEDGAASSETLLGIRELQARPIGTAEVAALARAGAHPVLVLRTFDLRILDDELRPLVERGRPLMRETSWVSAWCL